MRISIEGEGTILGGRLVRTDALTNGGILRLEALDNGLVGVLRQCLLDGFAHGNKQLADHVPIDRA